MLEMQMLHCRYIISYLVSAAPKDGIRTMFTEKRLLQFKLKVFPRGHTPTNYSKWFQSTDNYQVTVMQYAGGSKLFSQIFIRLHL